MSALNYKDLKRHEGHAIECVTYAKQNASIECHDCNEVLFSFDKNEEPEARECDKCDNTEEIEVIECLCQSCIKLISNK